MQKTLTASALLGFATVALAQATPPPANPYETQLKAWPPTSTWLNLVAREPTFSQPVEEPGGASLRGPVIGLVVADPLSGDPDCRVVQSSGKPRLDARACAHVRQNLKPQWAETVRFPVRRWALLLSSDGKGFRAIQPDPALARPAGPALGEVFRLTPLWRAQAGPAASVRIIGMLRPDGTADRCRIETSSGNEAADAAACHLFLTEAKFAPARDVFGQLRPQEAWVRLELR